MEDTGVAGGAIEGEDHDHLQPVSVEVPEEETTSAELEESAAKEQASSVDGASHSREESPLPATATEREREQISLPDIVISMSNPRIVAEGRVNSLVVLVYVALSYLKPLPFHTHS